MEEQRTGHQKSKEKKMTDKNTYKLSDSSIAQIVQLIQLGILTGTDISDQIRTLRLIKDDESMTLKPCPVYVEVFNQNLENMKASFDEEEQE